MTPSPDTALAWQGELALLCTGRREETPDTASFVLRRPDGALFSFLPGQFISVAATVDGRTLWRAYSISSSPAQPESLTITVRRVDGGRVSNWLLDHLQTGMTLPALAPAGDFALRPGAPPSDLVLLSSGCGITPMRSITRWLLDTGATTNIHFIHSARDEDHFIFRDELQTLAEQHPRLRLHGFLSQPKGGVPCHRGRLDAARLHALLPPASAARAYLCGQSAYMEDVANWLREAGFAEEAIIREDFAPIHRDATASGEHFRLDVPGFGRSTGIAAGELLLDALEREGFPIIGACRTGVCGACKCKLIEGRVDSASALPLTPEDQAAGYVLACSSRAISDLAVELG